MDIIGDTRGFSGKTPIAPSRGFSVETLTGATPSWKTEYLESCSTTLRCVARKVVAIEGGLVWFGSGFTAGTLFPDRWTCI